MALGYYSYHTNLKLCTVFFIKLCQRSKRVLPPHLFSDGDHKPKRLLLLTFYLVTFTSLQFQCQPYSSLLVAPIQPRAIASSQTPHPVSTFTHTLLKVLPHFGFTALQAPFSDWTANAGISAEVAPLLPTSRLQSNATPIGTPLSCCCKRMQRNCAIF